MVIKWPFFTYEYVKKLYITPIIGNFEYWLKIKHKKLFLQEMIVQQKCFMTYGLKLYPKETADCESCRLRNLLDFP